MECAIYKLFYKFENSYNDSSFTPIFTRRKRGATPVIKIDRLPLDSDEADYRKNK